MAKGFFATLKPLNARRLQKTMRATVQSSGRLTFAVDAVKEMQLSEDASLIILEGEGGCLGAALSTKGDTNAFTLRRCGEYFYVSFKNYLEQENIDFKNNKIIYDITEMGEVHPVTKTPLYKFDRRMIVRGKDDEGDSTDNVPEETAPEAQNPPPAPSEPAAANTDTPSSPSDESAVPAAVENAPADTGAENNAEAPYIES